jgi:Outer membrane protein beta-barrel domain
MKMKTTILCMTAAVISFSSVKAQSGVRIQAGLNLANVSVTDNGRVNNSNTLTSFQLGLIGDIHVGSIVYFQPGILYTGKGSKTESGDQNSTTYYKATSNPFYLEVPANITFKIPVASDAKVFVGAGPYLGIGVNGKNKVEARYANVTTTNENSIKFSNDDPTTLNQQEGAGFGILRRFDYGLNGTAGIEGKSIVLGVNYGYGLAKLQSTASSSTNDNNKHRVFSIILGIKL